MSSNNKQHALSMAIKTLEKTNGIDRNQGDWVIDLAKRYEAFLNECPKVDKFAILLHSHGNSALNTIKLIKDITGMDFMNSKDFITQLPAIVKNGISRDEAIMIKNHFNWSGCMVTIEKCLSM